MPAVPPLVDAESFAPHLYHGQTIRARAGAFLHGAAETICLTMWLQQSGTTELATGSKVILLRPGHLAVTDPGVRATWKARATVVRLTFDVMRRTRRTSRRGLHIPATGKPHPTWRESFADDPPGPLKAPEHIRMAILQLATTNVFVPRAAMRANQRLGLLILDLLAPQPAQAASPDARPEGRSRRLAQAAQRLFSLHVSQGIGVADVARQLSVTSDHLTRCMRAHCGRTPRAFVDSLRVANAKRLLAESGQDVETIARAVGLAGGRSLRVLFGRLVGMPPDRWRRSPEAERPA